MSQIDVVCYRPDVTAPTTPANLTATPSGTAIVLACDVATDRAGAADEAITGVVGYRFYSALTQGGTYSALTTEATPGYTHVVGAVQTRWYKVGAVDYVGNVSTLSAAVGATTGGNQAPVWSAIGSQQLYVGSVYVLALSEYVSDPESQPITITMTAGSLPVGLSFNAAAKRVEGTPTTAQQASATFSASDGFDATTQAVSFTVSVAPVIEFVAESGFTVTSSTGTFEHGATITITGTGFGAGPTDVHFAGGADGLIEAGTVGAYLQSLGSWPDWRNESDTGNKLWIDSDAERGKFIVAGPKDGVPTSGLQDGGLVAIYGPSGVPANSKLYFSQWFRRSAIYHTTGSSDRASAQHKTMRPYWDPHVGTSDAGAIQGGYLWFRQRNPDWPGGGGTDNQAWVARTLGGGEVIPFYSPSNGAVLRGRETDWVRIEVELDIGPYATSHAQAVSSLLFRVRGKNGLPAFDNTGSQPFSSYIGTSQWYRYCCFQNYLGNGYDGTLSTIRYDDCYTSIGLSRIELTNSATWGQETRAEIQGLQSWTDSQVTAKLNVGGVTNLIGMYLWRVIADGSATLLGQFIEQDISAFNVTLNWTAPTTGDTSIAAYRVEWGRLANGGFGEFINSVRVDAPATSVSLQLPPRGYAFRVVTVATDGEESQPAFLGTKLVDDAHVSLRP